MADKKPVTVNTDGSVEVFQTGDTVPFANLNLNGSFIGKTIPVFKSATQTIANNTITNDNHFSFSIGANETWKGLISFPLNANASGGFKTDMAAPSGATGNMSTSGSNAYTSGIVAIGTGFGVTANAANITLTVAFEIVNSSTPGTVNFRWAQNATFATGTTVGGGLLIAIRTA